MVNPDHNWELGICGASIEEAVKLFQLNMEKIKVRSSFMPEDITKVARIESMVFIGNDQLPKH